MKSVSQCFDQPDDSQDRLFDLDEQEHTTNSHLDHKMDSLASRQFLIL